MTGRRRLAGSAAVLVAALGLLASFGVVAHRDEPTVAVGFLLVSLWLGVALAAVGALVVVCAPGTPSGPCCAGAGRRWSWSTC